MAIVVELFGPPGAGKSSICEAVYRQDEAAGGCVIHNNIPINKIRRKSWKAAICASAFHAKHRRYLSLLKQGSRADDSDFAKIKIKGRAAQYARFFLPSDKAVLFDALFFQRFLGLAQRCPEMEAESAAADFVRAAPRADLIVMVDTPVDVAFDRANRRPCGLPKFFRGVPEQHQQRTFVRCADAARSLRHELARRGIRMIRCDGEHEPEVNAAHILSGVRELLA